MSNSSSATRSETMPDQGSARHPRGLYTLFVTEMWERFSYYGMRALLVLFMVDSARGGMGLTDERATAIYGLYTAGVYLSALPGGWLADRLLGARRAVWVGGLLIAAGHFTLAVPRATTFFLGLVLVVMGTGLLKPNISAMVGELYPEGGARRDAGFTIFYMGINLGAAIGPLICSFLGEKLNWHYGFAAAGVGMVLGLAQYRWSAAALGEVGRRPEARQLSRTERVAVVSIASVLLLGLGAVVSGVVALDAVALARGATTVIVLIAVCYFGGVLLSAKLDAMERRRVGVIAILFLASAVFWAGFEQMGSSFNLFAERYTDREIESLPFVAPAGWFQSLGPVFIIVFAPVAASIWVTLARRQFEPSLPVKFGFGLLLLAAGFLVMAAAAGVAARGIKAAPAWLITTYLLHTFGELCVSPVGLSSVTKLAPKRLVGQMMGTWFLATALGNLIAGLAAGRMGADRVEQMPAQFLQITYLPIVVGLALILLAAPIKKWIGGAR